ncbi:Bsp6I family type II restriction endonuclease [Candidatus Saccharibacteria bacterium]|nr:Bsp6I family type II restriction endonuclease [Candidatus Saccharibacteria bacterium]
MNKEYLIKIDEPRIQEACDAFFKWKDLNTYVKSLVTRGINMPDAISEPMGCYCLDLFWNKKTGGDAYTKDGKKIEFKATSNFGYDLSSFGPKCEFDDLIFLRFDLSVNMLYVYDTGINSDELKKIPVSKTGTVEDYQRAGKRPHIRIIEKIIEAKNLKPTTCFNIRRCQIVEDMNI